MNDGPRLIWRGGAGGAQEYRSRVYTNGTLSFFPVEFGFPGYVDNVLSLTQTGYVGIGTLFPDRPLLVRRNIASAHTAGFINENDYGVYLGSVDNTNRGSIIAWGGGAYAPLIVQSGAGTGQGFTGFGTINPLVPVEVRKLVGWASGTGANSHAPSTMLVTGGNSAFRNDWPNGWGGGISTWDICGASTFMTNYLTRSDRSYKTRIQSIGLQPDFVQKFMKLNPVTYHFNRETISANEWDYQRLHYGFIANEVEELFPDIVVNAGTDPSIKRGLEYDAFIPMLVKMVQEQQKMIEDLNKEVRSLKEQLQK